ncbi:MAG: hypothetical protein OIN86_11465 [Candidatus Methanoperedens sp.]|nr:hypothetical protein [Candidatus Methanoperedens sp.]CAG0987450.1 hypothetical protein METP1_02110 [Methanosarcinales archaeon]
MANLIGSMRDMLDALEAQQTPGVAELAKKVRCRSGSCSSGTIKKLAEEEVSE